MEKWKKIQDKSEDKNFLPVWKPTERAIVIGKFLKTETNVPPKGGVQYHIEEKNGVIRVWGSTVLNNKMSQIEEGSTVKIEYLGEVYGKTGKTYKNYDVFVLEDEIDF